MSGQELDRLKADASGNTGLSEALEQAVPAFAGTEDAVKFLESRGFHVSAHELADVAANGKALGVEEGGYGALLRFFARH